MESPEAGSFLSESQEADVDHLVDIFGEQQPIETLRQHVIEHRNEQDRVNIITHEIFEQNNHIAGPAAGRDNNEAEAVSDDMSGEDKFAILVDMFPNLDFENLRNTLEDYNGDLQKVVDKLSIPSHSTDTQSVSSGQKRQAEKRLDVLNVKQVRFANEDIDQSASGSDVNDQSASSSGYIDQSPTTIADPQSSVAPKRHNPEEIADRVRALMERFPDANPSALFHRLEECQNLNKREQELIEELIPPVIEPEVDMPGPSNRNVPSPNSSCVSKFGEFLSQEERDGLITIVQIFTDVDPNYVFEQIAQKQKTTDVIIEEMTRNSGYPKLKQRREKEKVERRRQEFLDGNKFKMEEYLRIFHDPETYFNDQERTVSQLYIQHAKVHLMNLFPNMKEEFLSRQLELHGNHLLPTIRTIEDGSTRGSIRGRGRCRGGTRRKTRNFNMPQYLANGHDRKEPDKWPNEIDEQFFRELQYIQHMDQIKELKQRKETEREERILNGRENGLLEECQCCFSDECLNDEMISCQINELHKFCKDCVRQHAETQVSEGQHRISCMAGDCKEFISFGIIQSLLRPNEVNLILRRWQQDELRNAQLDNMESCPSCDFAMIIENNDERVFRCQNPDCLKETCRECQEQNHIPLRCNEVEKDAETQMRTFIENKMAEAMIRICPKCNNRLIKSDGCNKLMCPCGSAICYVCRQQLPRQDPYSHFTGHGNFINQTAANTGCPLQTTMDQVHADVAETAGRKAREEYLRQHPELRQMKDIQVNNLVERGPQGTRPVVFGELEVPQMRVNVNFGHYAYRGLHAYQLALENPIRLAERRARAIADLMTQRQGPRYEDPYRMASRMRERVRRENEAEVFQADPLLNEHAEIARRARAMHAQEGQDRLRRDINPLVGQELERRHGLGWPEIVQRQGLPQIVHIATSGQMKPAEHGFDGESRNNVAQAVMIQPAADQQRASFELEEVDKLVQEGVDKLRERDIQRIDETVNQVVTQQTAQSASTPKKPLIGIFDVQPTFVETATTIIKFASSTVSSANVVVNPCTEKETELLGSDNRDHNKATLNKRVKKNDHAEMLKHVSKLQKQYHEHDANLKAAQRALPNAKSSKEGKEILKNVKTLLQQRDKILHQCQALEAELLKFGISEDKIGRQDADHFHLTNEEIHGAAQEATTLAAEAQAIRDQEINLVNHGPAASVLPEITPGDPLLHPPFPNYIENPLQYAVLPSRPCLLPNGPPQMQPFPGIPPPLSHFDPHIPGHAHDPIVNQKPHALSPPHVNEQLIPGDQLENSLKQAQEMLSSIPNAVNMQKSSYPLIDGQNHRLWCAQAEQLLLQTENGGFSYSRLWELIQFMRETFATHQSNITGHRVFAMDSHSREAYVHLANLWRNFVGQLSCHLKQRTNPHETGLSHIITGRGGSAHVPPQKANNLPMPSTKQKIFEQRQVISERRHVPTDSSPVQKIESRRRTIGKGPQSNESELQEEVQQERVEQEQQACAIPQAPEEHEESLNSAAVTPVIQKAQKTLPHPLMKKEMIDKYTREYRDVIKKLLILEHEGQSELNVDRQHKRKKDKRDCQHIIEKPTVKKKRKIEKDVQRQVVERELNALQTTVNAAEMRFIDLVMNNKLERVTLQERRQNAQTLIAELRNQIEQLTRQEANAENELKNLDRSMVEMTHRHNFHEDGSRTEMQKLHLKLIRLKNRVEDQINEGSSTSNSDSEDPDQPSTSGIPPKPVTQTVVESERLLQMIKKGQSMGLQDEIAKSIKGLIEFQEINKDSLSEDVTIIKVTKPRTPPVIVLSDDDEDPSDRPEIIYEHRMPQSTVQLIDDSVEIQRMKIPTNSGEVGEISQMAQASLSSSPSVNSNDEISSSAQLYDSAIPNSSPQFDEHYTDQSELKVLEPDQKIMRKKLESSVSLPLSPDNTFHGSNGPQSIQGRRSLSHDVSHSEINQPPSLWSAPTTPNYNVMPTTMDNGSFFSGNLNAENLKNERVSVSYGDINRQRESAAAQMHQHGVIQINIHLPQQMPEAQELEQLNDLPEDTGAQNEADHPSPLEHMDVEETL